MKELTKTEKKSQLLKTVEKNVRFNKKTVTVPASTWRLVRTILDRTRIEVA